MSNQHPDDDFSIGDFALEILEEEIKDVKAGKKAFSVKTGVIAAQPGTPVLEGIEVDADTFLDGADWNKFGLDVNEGSLKDPNKRRLKANTKPLLNPRKESDRQVQHIVTNMVHRHPDARKERTRDNVVKIRKHYSKEAGVEKQMDRSAFGKQKMAGPKGKLPEQLMIELTESLVKITNIIKEMTAVGSIGVNLARGDRGLIDGNKSDPAKKKKSKSRVMDLYKGYGK